MLVAFLGFVLTEVIAGAVAAVLDALPHDWALVTGEYFVHVVTTPVLGMGTAVLYYALLDREQAPDARRARRSGLVVTLVERDQASRTFLATAMPIATRMRTMSSFFMELPFWWPCRSPASEIG